MHWYLFIFLVIHRGLTNVQNRSILLVQFQLWLKLHIGGNQVHEFLKWIFPKWFPLVWIFEWVHHGSNCLLLKEKTFPPGLQIHSDCFWVKWCMHLGQHQMCNKPEITKKNKKEQNIVFRNHKFLIFETLIAPFLEPKFPQFWNHISPNFWNSNSPNFEIIFPPYCNNSPIFGILISNFWKRTSPNGTIIPPLLESYIPNFCNPNSPIFGILMEP